MKNKKFKKVVEWEEEPDKLGLFFGAVFGFTGIIGFVSILFFPSLTISGNPFIRNVLLINSLVAIMCFIILLLISKGKRKVYFEEVKE